VWHFIECEWGAPDSPVTLGIMIVVHADVDSNDDG